MTNQIRSDRFFLVLCVAGALAILGSTMSKNPVLYPFAQSLGTPEALIGFVAAASTVPGIIISLPAGSLSDVFGRKKIIIVSSAVFASAPFLYTVVDSWWQLMVVRFYHGFATAIFIPVARAGIASHYPLSRGERISMFTSATIVGRGIAPILGGIILSVTVWNYPVLYSFVGVVGIGTLLVTLVLPKEQGEKDISSCSTEKESEEDKPARSSGGWRKVLENPSIMIVSSIEAAARYVYGALEFFLTGYLKEIVNLDPSLIGVIMSVQLVLIPIAGPFVGRLSDRIGRKIPILAGLLISGFPLIAISCTTQFIPLLVISVMYGLGFSMVISSTPALVGDLSDGASYGASMGFLATTMDIGQMLGPVVTGIIVAAFGYSGSFVSLGIILLLFSTFLAVYARKRWT